jgi:hypothetical protein
MQLFLTLECQLSVGVFPAFSTRKHYLRYC